MPAAAQSPPPSPTPPSSPAASSLVQKWERRAILPDAYTTELLEIEKAALERLAPPHLAAADAQEAETRRSRDGGGASPPPPPPSPSPVSSSAAAACADASDAGLPLIEDMHQFYRWYETQVPVAAGAAGASAGPEQYDAVVAQLSEYRAVCDELLGEIDLTLADLQVLAERNTFVATKTRALHDDCEKLMREQEALASVADAMREMLARFDELSSHSAVFNAAALDVGGREFVAALAGLDACVSFAEQHGDFRASRAFLARSRAIRTRGLSLLRNEVTRELRLLGAALAAVAAGSGAGAGAGAAVPATSVDAEELAVKAGIRFRAAAARLRPLIEQLEKRLPAREVVPLLRDCDRCFCAQRGTFLRELVRRRLADLHREHGERVCDLTRSGCLYIAALCREEVALHRLFFSRDASAHLDALGALLAELGDALILALRPIYIRARSIEDLCMLAHMLRVEVLQDLLGVRGESAAPFRPVVVHMLQDIQLRLAYVAQRHIRDEIAPYVPPPGAHVESEMVPADSLEAAGETPPSASASAPAPSPRAEAAAAPDGRGGRPLWHPPLEMTLVLISKLYGNVDARIFEDLATEAVQACVRSIVDACARITAERSWVDARLFAIRHLVCLREQISPFRSDFMLVEKSLNFSGMRSALWNVAQSPGSVFRLSSDNALALVLRDSIPAVEEVAVDSRRGLDLQLRKSVEEFVTSVFKSAADPIESFLARAEAVVREDGAGGGGARAGALRRHEFATPRAVRAMLESVRTNFRANLALSLLRLRAFELSPAAQRLLEGLVRDRIVESFVRLRKFLLTHYSEEERVAVGLGAPDEISAFLQHFVAHPDEDDGTDPILLHGLGEDPAAAAPPPASAQSAQQ